MKIIGFGNALVDVLLQLEDDRVLTEVNIQKGAMDMIDENQMIAIQRSQRGLKQSKAPGGSGCNTMRAIAKLGGTSGFVGKIGSDEAGIFYEEAVKEANVTPYFVTTDGISGCCTVLISPDGERTMGTFLGPAATLKADDISDETLLQYECIYIEGYLIVNDQFFEPIIKRAKSLGLKVALDLSNFNIVNAFKPLLTRVIPQYVDILFSNESEAEAFTELPAEKAIDRIAEMVDISIVTLGRKGALIKSKDQAIQVPVYGGAPTDTTGAGDHFAAGFLYGLSVNASLEQAARIGALLAGEVVALVGAELSNDKWPEIKLKVNEILN